MHKIQVPYIDQSVKYPTGCESVSAVMLLQYLGYELTVDEFIHDYLECRAMEIRDGHLYGPDPNKFFCGSPYDADSFGIYARGLQKALTRAAGEQYLFIDETGTAISILLERYIDQGMPVVFWACINMREEIRGPEWRLLDTGETFCWISNEHCMLLVGYDEEKYYFNDPYENHGVIGYPKALVEKRHAAQYGMALGIRAKQQK
ncbi:C39 family peptidase [Blautia sp. MSJ-19]|uniref:C39 family peptidase n=1 Tax=Blautia sp. MSJ-19 TaxID=2841517 RepID=UPI002ED34B61